jgi:DNA replication licensing factor MCM5
MFCYIGCVPSFITGLFSFFLVVCSHKGAVAVRQPYIRVVGIEEGNEANSRGPAAFMPEEVSLKSLCKL